MAQTHTPEYRSSWIVWLAADLVLVLLFAASGRTTHASGLTAGGILATAGPFLAACLAAWTAVRAWRLPGRVWPTGLAVWIGTAGGGLLLRAATGGGVALSFQIVTFLVLGILMLAPRLVAGIVTRRKTPSAASPRYGEQEAPSTKGRK